MTVEELEKMLKNNQLNRMYLLYGEEIFLLENALKKIKSLFGKIVKGINYVEIDESNLNNLISDIRNTCIWV